MGTGTGCAGCQRVEKTVECGEDTHEQGPLHGLHLFVLLYVTEFGPKVARNN